jgi:hypothetical protein
VLLKIKEVEKKISEMKNTAIVFIPDEIKLLFPIICNINIFAFIKKMEMHKKNLVLKFKDIKNEIRFIHYKLDASSLLAKPDIIDNSIVAFPSSLRNRKGAKQDDSDLVNVKGSNQLDLNEDMTIEKEVVANMHVSIDELRQQNRLEFLYKMKEKMKEDIFSYMSAYSQIDELFSKEIKMADLRKRGWGFCFICFWKHTPSIEEEELRRLNPVLHKYFRFIFADE